MISARLHRDERGLAGASVARYIVVIAILGLVVVEFGSVLVTNISLQNAADSAVIEAADAWEASTDIRRAEAVARDALNRRQQEDAQIVRVEADPSPSYEVRLTVRKQASTLLVHRISFLEDLAVVEAEARGGPAEPGV